MTVQLIRRVTTAAVCLATAAATCTVLAVPASANTAGTNVVINEVYGGGGNSNAPFTNDFVELYNPTGAAISLDGWSVQYASATGPSWTNKTALSGAIGAHGHYLIQEGAGSGNGVALPTADATGTIAMSATAGKVALVSNNVALGCGGSCVGATGVVDFVGFGGANNYEGSGPAPTLDNTKSDSRTNGIDTDNNAADFTAATPPTPQNAASDGPSPLAVTNPGDQQAYVGASMADIDLKATGGTAPYSWSATGLPDRLHISHSGSIYGTPTAAGTSSVTVTVTDADDATASATFTFTVSTPAQVTIAQIQGTDTDTSPLVGQTVRTTGVVTAAYPTGGFSGFYLQTGGSGGTPAQDQTPGASDAVFVFGADSVGDVSVGESVTVTGEVQEYQGMTEIGYPTVTKLTPALPAVRPDVIPWSGLQTDAQKEAHEGELMAPQGAFTVSDNYDTNYYGSFVLAAGTTPLRQPTDAGTAGSAEAQAVVADNAKRMITLDDGSSWSYQNPGSHTGDPLPWLTPDNPARIGSAVTFHSPVILDYRYSTWNFQPTHQVTDAGSDVATFSDTRSTNQQPANVGGDVRLATFNVENYFPTTGEEFVANGGKCSYYNDRDGNPIGDNTCTGADGSPGPRGAATDVSFKRQQDKIVTGINRLSASIVSLEEIENSAKFGEDRDAALAGLVDALNAAAGAGTWAYVPSPDAADLPPLAEQDVIRTAFIYRPADVSLVGVSHVLTGDSGSGQAFSIAREPLAQEFKKAGAPDADGFLVVANHLKSKGADADGLFNDCASGGDSENTDPAYDQGAFNCTRVHQVQDMMAFASQTAVAAGTSRIFLLGDFNAYTHEDPMQELYGAGYTDLGSTFDPSEQTYSYDSLEGSLDHVLANPAALAMVTGADVWQINAQEAVAYAYSRDNYNVTQLFDGNDPFAASDHDPVVVGLTLPSAPAWNASTVYNTGDQVIYQGSLWQALWWTQNQKPGDPNGPWQQMVTAPDGTAVWTPSRVFNGGDVVEYNGSTWKALWYTRNQRPGDVNGPWEEIKTAADGTAIWTPTRVFNAGDVALYQGTKYVAQWYTRNQAPGQPYGPWKLAG